MSGSWRQMFRRGYWMAEEHSLLASAVAVGVIAGFAAALLVWMITAISGWMPEDGERSWWILVVPALGGLAVGPIVTKAAPETRGHGVPEVMLAVAHHRGMIRGRVAILKAIASAISIGSGGSAGREGPIVQIGSAVGSAIGRRMRMSPELVRMFVACGAAGGIAASFNTPIAGVIFALEVILRDFAGRAFATVVISAVTASVVSRTLLGQDAFFTVPPFELGGSVELLLYVGLGAIGAFVARAFVVTLYAFEDGFDALPIPAMLKPALGGLLLGALAYFLPEVLGAGHDPIEEALHGNLVPATLALLVVGKILATSFTLGSGGSGGVFAPSLFVGAMFGGWFGHGAAALFPTLGIEPGAYALVGMGVVFSGGTWAALSAILIIFEMTQNYGLMLPAMIGCVTATLVARRIAPDNVYTLKLRRRGIDLDEPTAPIMSQIRVEEIMTREVETVGVATPLPELLAHVERSRHSGFPVVDEFGRLEGLVTYAEMRDAMALAGEEQRFLIASDVMRPFGPTIHGDARLGEAVDRMRDAGVRRLAVLDPERPGVLVGLLTNHDVVIALAARQGVKSASAPSPSPPSPADAPSGSSGPDPAP